MSYPCLVPEGQQPIQIQMKVYSIGRNDKCNMKLEHPSISKLHAEIIIQEKIYVEDKQSLNGTFVNGVKIGNGQRMELSNGDIVQFGKYPILYTFFNDTRLAYAKPKQPTPIRDVKISVLDYVNQKSKDLHSYQQQLKSQFQQPLQHVDATSQVIQQGDAKSLKDNNEVLNKNLDTAMQIISSLEKENIELKNLSIQTQSDYDKKSQQLIEVAMRHDRLEKEYSNLQQKYQQVEPLIKDLQQRLELLQKDNEMKESELEEYKITDSGKKISIQNYEISQLKKILSIRDDEINDLKKQINQLISNTANNPSYHIQLLEQNSKEIQYLRKQLQQWENKDDLCNKKWTALLKDNETKDEQLKGLQFQIDRYISNIQQLYQEFDKRNQDLNNKVLQVIESQGTLQQRDAAQFLIQQVSLIQEERRIFVLENEELRKQLQELIIELELTKKDEFYLPDGTDVTQLIVALRQRVEEQNDMLNEQNYRDSTEILVQQEQLIEELESKLIKQKKKNKQLEAQVFSLKNEQSTKISQSQQDYFNKKIDDLNQMIKDYQKKFGELEALDKQKDIQLDNLKYQLNALTTISRQQQQSGVPLVLSNNDNN